MEKLKVKQEEFIPSFKPIINPKTERIMKKRQEKLKREKKENDSKEIDLLNLILSQHKKELSLNETNKKIKNEEIVEIKEEEEISIENEIYNNQIDYILQKLN